MRLSHMLLALGLVFSLTVIAAAADPAKLEVEGHVKSKFIGTKATDVNTITITHKVKGKDVDLTLIVDSKTTFVHKGKAVVGGLKSTTIHGGKEATHVHVTYHAGANAKALGHAVEVKVQ